MDNELMIALQTQRVLQRRMDSTANNLANATTNGFKADQIRFQSLVDNAAHSEDQPRDVRFVSEAGIVRDMGQGPIARTGSALDVALQGDGFFMVRAPDGGTAYTRAGSFKLGADGSLTTLDGHAVLSQGGAPLVFDPQGGEPTIDGTGAISIAGVEAGQLGIAKFANPSALQKIGDSLFSADGETPETSTARVVQYAIEGSNVKAVVELTNLIQISRAYEAAAQMVQNTDDLRKQVIQTTGRAA